MDPSSLTIFDSPQEAADACGDRILEILAEARRARGTATLAVSGGSTPRLMFQTMAKRSFDWRNVRIFQVDERCVPPDHELSNFRMIRESLLDHEPSAVQIEENQFHRMQGESAPAEAARLYVDDIRRSFNLNPGELPIFDVIQRGMGPDAHTASLFPGEPLIGDRTGIAAAVYVEKLKQHRITLLPGVLERARHTLCLTTGEEKAEALRRVLRGPCDPLNVPSQMASPDTVWYIDKSGGRAALNDPALNHFQMPYSMRRVRTAVPEPSPCWLPSSLAVQSTRMEFSDVSFNVSSPLAPPPPVQGQLICDPLGVPVKVKFTSGEMARSTIWKRER